MNPNLARLRRRTYYRLFGGDRVLGGLVKGAARVLDVGCSDGRGSEALTGAFGCDIHGPTLQTAADSGRRRPVAQTDVRTLPFRSGSFDVVVALDVIEHFDKADAWRVLDEMERVSRGKVVVVTPSGFVPQPPTETEPWQQHRSGFTAAELRARGYAVQGLGGWKGLRSDYAAFKGGPLGQVAALLTDPFVRKGADGAFHLLAVKSAVAT